MLACWPRLTKQHRHSSKNFVINSGLSFLRPPPPLVAIIMVRANGSVRPSPSVTPGPGAATPAFGPSGTPLPGSAAAGLQPVVGINFGNSYASIAVLTSEGQSECIATEDGERQIAAVISYHGDETVRPSCCIILRSSSELLQYIGNQAIPQLLKNSKNTIVGFRDLLGKKCVTCHSVSSRSFTKLCLQILRDFRV